MSFKEIDVISADINPFKKIGKEWFLVSAGTPDNYNTMTASWGGMGVIWGKNVFSTVIRPQRYTYEFVEANDLFTISFFGEECRSALNFCGAKSGRDFDKAKETGLVPMEIEGSTSFEQAEMIFVCKKLYCHQLEETDFIDKSCAEKWYNDDFHYAYIGEIVKAYIKE